MRGVALAAALALTVSACVGPGARPMAAPRPSAPATPRAGSPVAQTVAPSLAELIANDPALSRFRMLAAAGGLSAMVAGRGRVTILAPVDAAFARLPSGTVEALVQAGNRPSLLHLLRFWVVPGAWPSAAGPIRLTTLEGEPVLATIGPDGATLADAAGRRGGGSVTAASDGVLVRLDGVVAPASIEPKAGGR